MFTVMKIEQDGQKLRLPSPRGSRPTSPSQMDYYASSGNAGLSVISETLLEHQQTDKFAFQTLLSDAHAPWQLER